MTSRLRVVLVDDEAPARHRLARLLAECETAELVGQAEDGHGLRALCSTETPDLVFLDVEMPGADGLTLARDLESLPRSPEVVFVTAFENYAVDAFDLRAADYLVKPVRRERLEAALDRVRERVRREESKAVLVARLGDRVTRIPVPDIRVLSAEDKYVSVHYLGGIALVEDSLVQLDARYPDRFVRVHRNALVARQHLRSLYRDAEGAERVEVDGVEVRPEVSRRNLPEVRRVLKGQG